MPASSSSRNGAGSSSRQPYDVAPDEYQAPFSLPAKKSTADDSADQAAPVAVASSPFFDDKEAAEAMAWAASNEAVDDADDDGAARTNTRRKRRDSQVGSYDGGGSVFDGPSAGAVPSSFSSMHHNNVRPELGRRTSGRSRRRISVDGHGSPSRPRRISTSSAHSAQSFDSSSPLASSSHISGAAGEGSAIQRPESVRSGFGRKRSVRRASTADDDERPRGVLGSIMATFRGSEDGRGAQDGDDRRSRRPSIGGRRRSGTSVTSRASSRHGSVRGDDDEERDSDGGGWSDDYYGLENSEDDDSDSGRSSTSDGGSGRGGLLPSAFGTLSGGVDPIFGDARATLAGDDEEEALLAGESAFGNGGHSHFGAPAAGDLEAAVASDPAAAAAAEQRALDELAYLDKDSRSKQQIYLAEDDALIRFTGYRTLFGKQTVYLIACALTFGVLYLIGRWLPKRRLKWVCAETSFEEAEFVVIENQWGDIVISHPSTVPFARPLATAFPLSSRDPPGTLAEFQAQPPAKLPPGLASRGTSKNASAKSSIRGAANGDQPPAVDQLLAGVETEQLMELTFLDYRHTRFALHPPSGRWRMIKDWRDPTWFSTSTAAQGLTYDQEKDRSTLFGKNIIDVEAKSTWTILVDEVLHPFYVFQICSILLWSLDDYYIYASCIAIISIGSIITTLVETKGTVQRMREMSRFSCDVRVLREGQWTVMDSSELVPGDVYDVAESGLLLFPSDSVLLSGDAIVNESMLTGESVPVSKMPISDATMAALHQNGGEVSAELAKHFLFAGTRIIRILGTSHLGDKDGDAGAKAMVVRTGFDTTKGALVRSMLFPKPMGFKFYRDSFRFIGFLAGIAGVGFLASSVNFVKLGIAWHTIVLRALDLITVVVPPALPATMSIGTTFAISRLRKNRIFCIAPNRVNIGGKVNVFCFDKTGTLTADGLDVLGTRTVDLRTQRFSELHEAVDEMPSSMPKADEAARKMPLLYALATCHSLKVVDGEVIGDPLDVKMFEYTGWTLDEGKNQAARATTKSGTAKDGKSRLTERAPALVQTVVRPPGSQSFEVQDAIRPGKHAHFLELGVLRTFEFVSSLRRMSVIAKRLRSQSMEVFVKGAPEVMADICVKESFPADYDDLLAYYTKHGYRVIACAGKSMQGMSWIKAQRMRREQAESGLRFLGLIIFENKIKEGTAPAISALTQANIVCKMVTGDNPRTAISVARECGMVGQSAHVFIPTLLQGDQRSPNAVIDWSSVDDERIKLDPYRLTPRDVDPHVFDADELDFQDYQLALSGDVFRWMVDYAPVETLRRMLVKGTIFARMSPDEKHELIERLQALGYTVGMCGDGANDCGALKAADVGISLSEAEASVAAPFTSSSPDISCVLDVIREGRAALVTSFSCFKYMALYSMIQFGSISLLYSFASSLGDFQYLWDDLFLVLPVAIAMAWTLPYTEIHTKRPTANLVSKKVLISILGQVLICGLVQTFTFFYTRAQPWYEPPVVNPDELNTVNPENSALFLVSAFQYLITSAVFSVGPPYRQPMHTNLALMACFVVLGGTSLYFLFVPSGYVFDLLGLVEFPRSFHYALLAIVVVNLVASFVFEACLVAPAARSVKALQRVWRRGGRARRSTKRHETKLYKAIAEEMQGGGEA